MEAGFIFSLIIISTFAMIIMLFFRVGIPASKKGKMKIGDDYTIY